MTEIKTKRLIIETMAKPEMRLLVHRYKKTVPHLSAAYGEMLDNCIKYPEQYDWYASWKICLAANKTEVGFAGFKGFNNGVSEIGYGINNGYCGNGYATEAVIAMCAWAMQTARAVQAETEIDNIASQRVLEKSGFIKSDKNGEEGPVYILSSR